jgi:hypothetical protein
MRGTTAIRPLETSPIAGARAGRRRPQTEVAAGAASVRSRRDPAGEAARRTSAFRNCSIVTPMESRRKPSARSALCGRSVDDEPIPEAPEPPTAEVAGARLLATHRSPLAAVAALGALGPRQVRGRLSGTGCESRRGMWRGPARRAGPWVANHTPVATEPPIAEASRARLPGTPRSPLAAVAACGALGRGRTADASPGLAMNHGGGCGEAVLGGREARPNDAPAASEPPIAGLVWRASLLTWPWPAADPRRSWGRCESWPRIGGIQGGRCRRPPPQQLRISGESEVALSGPNQSKY